jgi:peptidase C25-like protein
MLVPLVALAGLWQTPAEERPLLVVLAPSEWSAALEPFVAARAGELRVERTALEDVLANDTGVDPPERIKRHLHAAWRERGARYALLVGDADTFPVRFMALDRCTEAAANFAFYASDLYYADVARADGSFDDWNAEREGFHARYFGEVRGECNKDTRIDFDRVSYVPELAVGRWPVSSAEELAAVVAKTVAWRAPDERRALLVHADGWVDERERLRSMGRTLERGGFALEPQLFARPEEGPAEGPGEGATPAEPAPTPASVLAGLRREPVLALHLGHGSEETWHACLGPVERDALAATRAAVMMSVGCSTGHLVNEPPYQAYLDELGVPHRGTNAGELFHAPPPPPHWLQPGRFDSTGLGERLVRMPSGGAVVYIGCTTGAQPCAVTLMEGFVEALATSAPELRVGDAWREALAHYWRAERLAELVPDDGWYPPSVFFQGMKFVLLGDPTLRLGGSAGR